MTLGRIPTACRRELADPAVRLGLRAPTPAASTTSLLAWAWPSPAARAGVVIDDLDGDGAWTSCSRASTLRSPALLPSAGGRLLPRRGRGGGARRTSSAGINLTAGRLRQRRAAGPLRDARGLGVPDPQLPAAPEPGRHVHRRDRAAGLAPPSTGRTPRPSPTSTTTAGSTSSSATSSRRPPSSGTAATAPSRTSRARAGVDRVVLHQGRGLGRLRQRRPRGPLRLELRRAQLPLPQRRRRPVPRGRGRARAWTSRS